MIKGGKIAIAAAFVGSVLVFTALAAFRPGDSAHVVSETTPEGGKARHGAHFSYGTDRCSVLVTSNVKLDRRENLRISVEGANPPPFQIIGRNPSVFNLGIHDWPQIEGSTIYDVEKDKIAFYVVFSLPEKDPVCGMWVNCPESGDTKECVGKTYQFCSVDCRKVFSADSAKFADKPLDAEKCKIVLTDSQGRRVLSVPVVFSDPRAKGTEHSSPARADTPSCHDAGTASGTGRYAGGKNYQQGVTVK